MVSGLNFVKNLIKATKMTSVKQLTEQSEKANSLIAYLHQEINSIRETLFKNEQNRLKSENEALRKEVEEWKQKLIQLEIAHGVNQVELPAAKRIKETPKVTAVTTTVPAKKKSPSPPKDSTPTPKAEKPAKPDKKAQKEATKQAKPNKPMEEDEKIDVGRLDLRIGRIQAIDKHPDADALYVEQIDLAEDKPRTIVSGLVKHVTAEELKDKLVMVLCNLKPAKMRGVTSEGMVMCASSPDKVEVLIPPQGSIPGDKVTCPGFENCPDAPFMNPKKKVFEQVAPDLKANDQGVATYKGIPFEVTGKGQIKAPSMKNCQIK